MNAIARLALATATLSLAACASMEGGSGGSTYAAAPAASGSSTSYCMMGRLAETSDALTCTWAKSVKDACAATSSTTIRRSAVASGPDKGLVCPDGEKLVRVTTK